MNKTFKYGGNDTIHSNKSVDVEVDNRGRIVAVWFRCMRLKFRQSDVSDERAISMKEPTDMFDIDAIDFIKEK